MNVLERLNRLLYLKHPHANVWPRRSSLFTSRKITDSTCAQAVLPESQCTCSNCFPRMRLRRPGPTDVMARRCASIECILPPQWQPGVSWGNSSRPEEIFVGTSKLSYLLIPTAVPALWTFLLGPTQSRRIKDIALLGRDHPSLVSVMRLSMACGDRYQTLSSTNLCGGWERTTLLLVVTL